MSKDIDIAKIDAIFNSQSTSSKVEGDKGIQDTEDNGIDISKIEAIFNANKVEDDATAEQKERLETSFALGNLNRSFMGKQMDEIKSAIPDTTEQEAYDYLTTDAEDGSTDAIRGTALADRIKSGYAITKGDAEDREFIQTKYTLADELVATLPLADPINSTDVMVGAKRMPRGQAERVMAQVVENTMHPDLLKSNEAYRNNFFMENYGTTAEKYLIDLDKKLAKLQASLDKEIKRDMDAMPSLMRGGVAGGVDPRAVQSFVESESYGGNTIRNAREKIQSILNNNFASGVDEGFDALSALSLGINDIMSGVSINNILSKSAAGKPLTKRESVALEAYDISEELEGLQDIIAPPSWGNKVGQGLGTTAEMAMPFIPAMSIAGSVGKLATLPIRASAKLTRRAFNKGVVNGVTTGMKRAASLAGKSLHNVGVSTLSGLVTAPLMPSTWSTFVDNRNKRFEIKDGKVVAHDRSVWKDLANAWIESAGEIGSERIGIRMDELIKGSASSLGRALAIDNLSSKAGKILFGGKTPAYIKSLQQKAGFTGYLSEPLSEVWGDAVVNLMKMGLTGDDNFAEMGNADYWTTTLATCALYGTGLKMATEGLPMTKRIADIERIGRYRKNALNGIESESLYNTMVSILAEEDIEAAAKRLSEIKWNKYHRIDIGHAMDAIRAHYAQSVALSSETETARLNSFMGQVGDIANITYRGKEGNENTNEVVTITDKNGVKYMAISGDSTTPFYVCLDANLERKNILSSDVVDVSRTTLEERMATAYSEQFSTEIEMERQQQLIDRYNEVRAGVGGIDAINRVRTLFGTEEHHSGDDVTLADGTQAIVEEYLPETGEYVVTKVDGTMECVPFYNILSTNAFTAEAQSLSFAQRALSTAENEIDIEEDVENATETEQITESDTAEDGALAVGDVVITPTGERVRIRAINEDGSYEVDYNTAERVSPEDMEIEVFEGVDLKAESAEVAPAQDVLTDVDTSPISEGVAETVTEETSPVAPQIENKPIPTNEDGTINYEAIEDPKQFVDLYSHEAGGIDTAITDVKEMRDSAVAEVAKNAEQGKKITSPNEKIANRKKQEALAQKVAFYDSVLAELEQRVKPTEDAENATPVEDVVSGTEDVVGAETAEDITEDATTSETKIEEAQPKEVGLVDNELSKDLRKSIYNTLNALGEALGIQIELVDAIDRVKANGQIIGNRIQIAWKDRMKAVTFVAGHEFLHRLKDIAPEQYEKFKESVKNDLGEDGFAARINRMRRNYEYTNEQRIKKGQEPLAYTDTLLEEEVIADRMGEYVENADAFNHYLESIKPQNALLRAIRDAWVYIKNLFKGAEYRAETKRINDMLEAIDALIDAGASAIKKAQNTERVGESNAVQDKERHSIIGEVGASALDMAEEATTRLDNLNIARQMEERGDSALDIRMATGWERGADGLWRYEIMDAEVNLYDGDENTIRKKIEVAEEEEKDFMQQSKADTKELRERTNAYLAQMREKYGVAEGEETDAMTEEEIAQLQSLTNKEIEFEDYKERRRNELYNRRMALEAQLGYVRVKNTDDSAMILSTRLGHILQGNDAEVLFAAHPSLRDIEVQFVTDIRDGAFAAYATKGGYKRIELNAKKTPVDMLAPYILHEVQHAIQDIEGFAGGGNLSSLQSDENVTAKEAYDYYRKIAGEVEARNVSARINMTPEERRATLLSETEDVAREDQIFLREGAEMAMKEAEVSESIERLREQGAIVDAERGDVRYSIADVLTGDQREQAIADLMRVTGRSRRTVINYLKAEESLANIILSGDNKVFLDIQVDESVPSIWNNSDYPQGTVEFSNICRKRLPFTMIYQRLQKDFPNTVFDASSLESIRQTLIANGEEVACGLCFVEDRRQLLGEIGQGFINALSGKEIELNEKQREAISRLRESGDTYIPNLYELITLDGMKILRKEHPEIANAFVAYNNARGMQAGRLFQAYSAYHRDILNYDAKKVAKINNAGGLRIFSFSDFEAHHLIDLVQVLTDCAAKGIKVQGYTKVPQFAKAVKDTKMKVNRSLIAKAKGVVDADYIPQEGEAVSPNIIDGKRLLFDTVEGINVDSPDFFDSTDSKSVGNILVGINDEHIRIAMLDPFVDYIIGFHTGLSEAIREQKGIADWTNYKYTQLEKILKDGKLVNADKHGINIYTEVLTPEIKTERQFVRKYLKVCEEKGWIPKYHRFLNKSKSGKFIYTKGYYKLLLDFKMFDANGRILPQEVVVPVFDNEVNKQILEDYVADEKAKAPNDELYGKVVDAMVEQGRLTEAQVDEAMGARYSMSSPEETAYSNVRYSLQETDPATLDMLNNGETIKVYRAMQIIDGKLYPPMSAKVDGKLRAPIELGVWERAEERPDLADERGYFKLDKGNKASLKARYNPYIHTSLTPLNDQFSSAQDRPNLVTVEVEVPISELTSGYKAEKAKDAVGKLEWKAGVVQGQLTGTRTVILSRWDRPLRIVPDSEVAQRIVEMFGGTNVIMPSNVVTPSLRAELEKLGVPFKETDNQGKEVKQGQPRFSLITPEMDASYLDAVERGDMATAQRMVMEAAKLAGYTIRGEHGTTHKFTIFNYDFANKENSFGVGHYFTSDYDDAVDNYSTNEGPDLKSRIQLLAERMEFDPEYEDMTDEERLDIATQKLSGGENVVISAALRMDNPAVFGEDADGDIRETYFDYSESYDEETEEYDEPEGLLIDFVDALNTELSSGDYWGTESVELWELTEDGGIYANELRDKVINLLSDTQDNDGNMVSHNIFRNALVRMGFDGIIDNEPSIRFSNMGLSRYTKHYIVFDSNQIKLTDPVTYDDNGNVIPLSERFKPEKEDIRYSLSEETTQIFDAAKAKFGTTYDMREAGYILPDGSMLDFSGRHQVEGDASFLNGDRTVDHRDISDIAYDADDNETGIKTDLGDFLDRGAIRIDYNAGAINLNVAPTKAQKDRLKRLIERNEGYVYVDFGKGWDTEHYAEYEAARASRVLGDIDRYFDEGIKPTGNVRFSLQNFNDKVNYLTYEANTLGVQSSVVIAENKTEYLAALKDAGVKNIDKYRKSVGVYIRGVDIIIIDAGDINNESYAFEVLLHEYAHANSLQLKGEIEDIVQRLGVDQIYAYRDEKLGEIYKNNDANSVLNEIISFFVEKIPRDKIYDFFNGYLEVEDLIMEDWQIDEVYEEKYTHIFKALMPVIGKNLELQKNNYNGKEKKAFIITREHLPANGEVYERLKQNTDGGEPRRYRTISTESRVYETGRGGESTQEKEVTPRHSIHSADSYVTGAHITEETIRAYMKRGHQVTKANIRKKYKAYRDVAKSDYAEKRRVRLDKIKTLLTNSAKVDYIFGDIDEYSTPYLHQAFAKIARGEVRIVWDNSPDGKKRGIASETGAKKGEKRLYASITKGATLYFEEYVHQWWQELNGYENDIDTQELRNALIEALSEVCNANGAISKLREIYDNDQKTLDEALDVYDREEDRELADETARYEQEVADFEQNKDAKISEFESSLSFFDELAVIDGTISEMRSKLEKILEKSRSRVATEKMNTREIREAIAEIKRLIKNAIDRQTIASMQRNELRSMLDKIDKARSINQVSAIGVEIENTILEAKIRFKRRELDTLLRLRIPDGTSVSQWVDTQVKEGLMSVADSRALLEDMWRGRNSSGVSVAKFVDPATAKTMEELRKLVMQTLKTKIVEDVDAEERGKVSRRDEELSLDVKAAMESNNGRLDELANKKSTQERVGVDRTPTSQRYTDADAHEYAARSIYDTYLRTIALKQDIADIAKWMDDVRIDYYGMTDKVAVRDYKLEKLREEMVEARRKYAEALENLNNEIMQLMREGKNALSAFRMEQDAHKSSIVKLGLDALRVNTKLLPDKGNVWERTQAFLRGTTNASYNTFQTTLKEIDRFAPNGEGRFYNYFMGLWQECENKLFTQHSDNCSAVASMLRTTLGLKGKNDADIISAVIEQADAKFLGTITYSKGVDRTGDLIEPEEKPITVSTAMFIIAMWRQTMYRNSLIKHGIDQQMIDTLYDLVNKENEGYITFMNWVNESLLPNTRLVYDKVHREMFGASMAEERNYFPARVVNFQETVDVGNDSEGALPSTITGAIINRKKNALMPDITQNYFKVLMGHLQEMDQWSAFAPLIRDLNTLLSNTEFKNACRQYKGGVKADRKGLGDLYSIFRNVSAIAVDAYKPKRNDIEDAILKAMRGWAGSNIAWRLLTAIKQLSSMPVFALYALDGKMQKEFVKSIAYCLSHPKAVSKWAMANSPQFRKRWESKFAGLDILNTTIGAEDGIADLNSWSKTKWGRGSKTLDKGIHKVASEMGMSPNAFVDAISVVVGLRAIYNYELNKLMKRDGNTIPNDKQKYEAMRKAEIVFNTTQQSGESAYLSTVQSDRSLVLRGLTIYQNSPFAFHRLMVSGVSEIAKQMTNAEYRNAIREEYGDKALSDARKKAYAQLMQSAAGSYLFALMGQAIANGFYSLVGGDDDEYRSYKNVLWGATATFLFGGVVGGAVIISGLQGYGFSLTAAWDDAVKSIEKLLNVDNWLSGEAVYEAINIVARYKYGVDLDTFTNIATGIQGYFEGSGNVEATMKILNAPRSQVNLVAGVRRDGETIMEYVTRIMRAESLLSVPDYYTLYSEDDDDEFIGKGVLRNSPFRVSEYQAKKYHKQYAASYNSNVVTRFGGASQLSTMKEVDSKYAERAKAIEIIPNSIPSSKTIHKVLSTNGNEEDLIRLLEAQMEVGIVHKEMERFVGTDENYYKKAVELNKAKENFISIYDELNK